MSPVPPNLTQPNPTPHPAPSYVQLASLNEIRRGDVVVIRYQGPKGGPGMPEMRTRAPVATASMSAPCNLTVVILHIARTVAPTSAIMGAGLGKDVALVTDGRFSGGSHVRC